MLKIYSDCLIDTSLDLVSLVIFHSQTSPIISLSFEPYHYCHSKAGKFVDIFLCLHFKTRFSFFDLFMHVTCDLQGKLCIIRAK